MLRILIFTKYKKTWEEKPSGTGKFIKKYKGLKWLKNLLLVPYCSNNVKYKLTIFNTSKISKSTI